MFNIGIDMDGTLLNNESVWASFFDEHREAHGHRDSCHIPVATWSYIRDLCPSCFEEVVKSPYLLAQSPFYPGTVYAIEELAAYDNLYLVSSRPPELTPVIERKLAYEGILGCFQELNLSWEPKLTTCRARGITIMVDDAPKNITSLQRGGIDTIIFDQLYNRDIPGLRAKNWKEVIQLVDDIKDERAGW